MAAAKLLGRPPSHNETPSSTRDHVSAIDRTMWRWANVENLDDFFQRVYMYYQGKGLYAILLGRFLNLVILGFVILFSTFLIGCVDYAAIPDHHALADVVVPQCYARLSPSTVLFLIMFVVWWAWQLLRFIRDIPALKEMHNFYNYLLKIPDSDIQTVSWQQVITQIMAIRETNPNTSRSSPIHLDAHAIASRIMRKENYLIALFNKDTLDITIPLPYLRHKYMFTRDLEWNLSFCVLSYVFDHHGQLRKRFLHAKNRPLLVAGLRRRFIFMALLNLTFAPFILVYLLVYFFFGYFEAFRKNPSEIGSRNYSPFAKWKFREFNELPHEFRARVSTSVPIANQYLDQFPKEKTALLARFVAFISGSFAAVLLLLTLYDAEAFVNFEITPSRTVFFYTGIFGAIFGVARGMIPDEHLVFEPESLLRQVMEHTHYFPNEWRGQLHTDSVRAQFCQLFDYKVSLFVQELASVFLTPIVLGFSLPQCADQVVDFFREFSIHVDGVGTVCSFAQFDFARHGNVRYGAPVKVSDDHYLSKGGKMEKSFLNFKANHPEWEPTDMTGSMYLTKMTAYQHTKHGQPSTRPAEHGQPHPPSTSSAENEDDLGSTRQSSTPLDQTPPPDFAFQRSHFVPTITPSSVEFSEPPTRTTLNQYGVPEGRVPSNLGDSFAKPKPSSLGQDPYASEEEDNLNSEAVHHVPGVIGILNQVYDLNNNPTM
ncbi:APG9-domain-containing protein [Hesseltinella vesiculosa]|uniref:Autophagy-related protein 9 n=1 Tax=Hesseltinella vesiculosa TaxID=101127 RepID=A0A1X2GHC6_9FUNG|nr:APG9-domain-containing protein [Hesseltinella vesiculosa]